MQTWIDTVDGRDGWLKPLNSGIIHLSTDAGFPPSTVFIHVCCLKCWNPHWVWWNHVTSLYQFISVYISWWRIPIFLAAYHFNPWLPTAISMIYDTYNDSDYSILGIHKVHKQTKITGGPTWYKDMNGSYWFINKDTTQLRWDFDVTIETETTNKSPRWGYTLYLIFTRTHIKVIIWRSPDLGVPLNHPLLH